MQYNYQDAWLCFIGCCCFLIVNRLFLSNLCQWHTIYSDRFTFGHFSPIYFHWLSIYSSIAFTEFNTKIEQTIHGNDCSQRVYGTKKKWVVVVTWRWIYNELFTFWTNEKQINDRNFYLTLFFSLFFFISVFIFQFHLFIQWTAYTHIHYVFALLANTYEELSTLILCDNERI